MGEQCIGVSSAVPGGVQIEADQDRPRSFGHDLPQKSKEFTNSANIANSKSQEF